MKKRIVIGMTCFALVLSGCALFPLKEEVQPLVLGEEDATTDVASENVSEDLAQVEEDKPSGQVVKPAGIVESEEETKNLVYCISPVTVREDSSSASLAIGSLETGDAVAKVGQDRGWVEIIFEGRHGYVYGKYVRETP